MNEVVSHRIQKHILKVLTYQKYARFKDMKPEKIDSNLYNYHLKLMLKSGLIEKVEPVGYTLSSAGLSFADSVSLKNYAPRIQPKISTLLFILSENQVLLWPKLKQPFISSLSLPNGKVHYEDKSLESAARRELDYLASNYSLKKQLGVVELVIYLEGKLISHQISHIFEAEISDLKSQTALYYSLNDLKNLSLAPGTNEIIKTCINEKIFFYKHINLIL